MPPPPPPLLFSLPLTLLYSPSRAGGGTSSSSRRAASRRARPGSYMSSTASQNSLRPGRMFLSTKWTRHVQHRLAEQPAPCAVRHAAGCRPLLPPTHRATAGATDGQLYTPTLLSTPYASPYRTDAPFRSCAARFALLRERRTGQHTGNRTARGVRGSTDNTTTSRGGWRGRGRGLAREARVRDAACPISTG